MQQSPAHTIALLRRHIDHIHARDSHGVQLRECQITTESLHSAHMFVIIVILKSASIQKDTPVKTL